jgi:uncharacterized membrane protein
MGMTRIVLSVAAVVAMGLVAGLMLGTLLNGFTARSLPEASWVLRFQAEDRLFAKIMPPIFLTTLVLQIVACALNRGAARGLFLAATVLVIGVLLVTNLGEVPLNHIFQLWTAGSAPADWAELRDRWLRNHLVRTVMGAVALVCAVCGLTKVR